MNMYKFLLLFWFSCLFDGFYVDGKHNLFCVANVESFAFFFAKYTK